MTTNFDPLLSVAIKRAHRVCRAASFSTGTARCRRSPRASPVIHLHGYWRGSNTHHTGMELTAARPQLVVSLARLLNERLVVVVGYEGWDDAFIRAV